MHNTGRQRRDVLDTEIFDSWVDEQYRFVETLAAHFPGLAPAIRAVAHHVWETPREEQPGCREEGHSPAEVTPTRIS